MGWLSNGGSNKAVSWMSGFNDGGLTGWATNSIQGIGGFDFSWSNVFNSYGGGEGLITIQYSDEANARENSHYMSLPFRSETAATIFGFESKRGWGGVYDGKYDWACYLRNKDTDTELQHVYTGDSRNQGVGCYGQKEDGYYSLDIKIEANINYELRCYVYIGNGSEPVGAVNQLADDVILYIRSDTCARSLWKQKGIAIGWVTHTQEKPTYSGWNYNTYTSWLATPLQGVIAQDLTWANVVNGLSGVRRTVTISYLNETIAKENSQYISLKFHSTYAATIFGFQFLRDRYDTACYFRNVDTDIEIQHVITLDNSPIQGCYGQTEPRLISLNIDIEADVNYEMRCYVYKGTGSVVLGNSAQHLDDVTLFITGDDWVTL